MKENIIGRKEEQEMLQQMLDSHQSEFWAVCGRRRVGKTFLVREFFEQELVFQCSGLSNRPTKEQLKNFQQTLRRYWQQDIPMPADWLEAFDMLIDYLSQLPQQRKVVFLDELPWMNAQGSNFIAALEHFWNGYASARRDIVLIVCGSATSWMMDNLIHNHGGLYGRLTGRLLLQPFSLRDTESMLTQLGFRLSRYEVALCYMTLGGIPYYLSCLDPRLSLAQNIDRLLFNPNGRLYDEFHHLYAALFRNSDDYIKVVEALSRQSKGLTRNEIIAHTGLSSGKALSSVLENLESCGFIRHYTNYDKATRNAVFQLIDFYTLFYFRFLKGNTLKSLATWQGLQRTPAFYTWAGYSFELLALTHVEQIRARLGISGVHCNYFAWRNSHAQIDLIIDRNDNTVNLCEMKFSESPFLIDSQYEEALRRKIEAFISETKTRKSVQLTFVTTYGVTRNTHSGIMQNEVLLDHLFA